MNKMKLKDIQQKERREERTMLIRVQSQESVRNIAKEKCDDEDCVQF